MIEVRPVSCDELEKLIELNKRIFINNPKYDEDLIVDFADTDIGRKFFAESINNKNGVCLVAEEDGEFVGYVSGGRKEVPYRRGVYFEIDNLGVVPEQNGRGIGRMLMESVTNWAKENGYTKIYVESYARNMDAISFYRKNGFNDIDLSLEKKI